MPSPFKTIGLIGRQRKEDISDILDALKELLQQRNLAIVVETETATHMQAADLALYARDEIGKHCDLLIVVGGDGNLLSAAHAAVDHNTPVLGINRGRLGFLTDIHPNELNKVSEVLDGHFVEEQRFMLTSHVSHANKTLAEEIALNDIVLLPGDIAHMIEFDTAINDQFMSNQHADGLIVATPTGSTAYALSGGGPILHPSLDAVVLVPMFPHTLSARPIVVAGDTTITISISEDNESAARLSCDGQAHIPIPPGTVIRIQKKPKQLRLIHPKNYNYFETLRVKLHWNLKTTG